MRLPRLHAVWASCRVKRASLEPFAVRFFAVPSRFGSCAVWFLCGSVPAVPVSRFAVRFPGLPDLGFRVEGALRV